VIERARSDAGPLVLCGSLDRCGDATAHAIARLFSHGLVVDS
jgi:hypothetical protein